MMESDGHLNESNMTKREITMDEIVEGIARKISPEAWRVMDGYLAETERKYRGQNAAWPADQFKHKASLAVASATLTALLTTANITPEQLIALARGEAVVSERFKTFSPSGRADIPADAPEELAAMSTLDLMSTPMTTTPEQRAEWAVDARVYGSSRAADGSIHMIALASIAKNVVPALISHIEALEAENARLKEALAWFHHNGKALASDIYSAHRLRGNGASQWMTEDDRDFRRDLDAALDRARAAMGESE